MCITGGVIFFIVRSYTNAETENYQFNCRKYTDSCYYQRQLCLLNWIDTLVHNYLPSTDVDKHNIVPFTECVNEIRLTVNGTHYMRWQLPLILAYSITTHKSQSMTAHNGIVYEPSKNKPFARGLPYVAISRATDIEKVALLLPIRPDHFINKNFIAENIKINEFYNNLNKKFNTDEEI